MRLVCLSDTHNQLPLDFPVPDGDVLIFAGDITSMGYDFELFRFIDFVKRQPHRHKLLVAGNHDWCLAVDNSRYFEAPFYDLRHRMTYLQDSGTVLEGVKFWGSPWQPRFCDWAFNLDRGEPIAAKWRMIPSDTDVLITHGPPFGILDTLENGMRVGCEDLASELKRIQPKAHIFGHIHSSYGMVERDGCTYVNASICDEQYKPTREPIIVDI